MTAPKKGTKFKSVKGIAPQKRNGAPAKPPVPKATPVPKSKSSSSGTLHPLPSQAKMEKARQAAQPPPKAVLPPGIPVSRPPKAQGIPIQGRAFTPPQASAASQPLSTRTGSMHVKTLPGSLPSAKARIFQQSDIPPEKMLEMKVDELTDQVNNLLEVADSLLNPEWSPESIIDIVHLLVRSLNLDVVCMALPALRSLDFNNCALNRGFDRRPGSEVLKVWFDTYSPETGIDWQKLMAVAADKKTYSSYWIVEEGLDCIGYVPLRDGNFIHGFLFVAAKGKKKQSPLTSPLLDLCGSHIGLSFALKYTGA